MFDVVYFGFCLYLVDRFDLFQVVAEADRVLKTGGFLFITDFDPRIAMKRKYHHKEGVYSYKMKYENLFLGSPSYTLIEKRLHHIVNGNLPKDEDMVSTCVLQKGLDPYFLSN